MANTFEKGLALGLAMGGLSVTTKVAPPEVIVKFLYHSTKTIGFSGIAFSFKPLFGQLEIKEEENNI